MSNAAEESGQGRSAEQQGLAVRSRETDDLPRRALGSMKIQLLI